jgi:hypothetical protein
VTGCKVLGNMYPRQLKTDDVHKIETIWKKRKEKGKKRVQYLIKLHGYPNTFNSWIFRPDLQKHSTHSWIVGSLYKTPGFWLVNSSCIFGVFSYLGLISFIFTAIEVFAWGFNLFFPLCRGIRFEAREGKKVKYVFANTTAQREKKIKSSCKYLDSGKNERN